MRKLLSLSINKILILINLLMVSIIILPNIEVNAASPKVEIYFTVSGKNADVSMDDFLSDSNYEKFDKGYMLTMNIKPLVPNVTLGAIQFTADFGNDLINTTGKDGFMGLFGEEGRFGIDPYHNISRDNINRNRFIVTLANGYIKDNYVLPTEGIEFMSLHLNTEDPEELKQITGFKANLDIDLIGDYDSNEFDFIFRPLTIGEPDAEDNATLKSLDVIGEADENINGDKQIYETSVDPIDENKNLAISYQDSLMGLKGLDINPTPTKAGATVSIDTSGLSLPILSGDSFKITIEDGSETKVYTRTITVNPASSVSDITINTNKDSQIKETAKEGNTTTIKVPYSVTDIKVFVKPNHWLTTIDKDGEHVFGSLIVGKNTVVFTVTPENGVPVQHTIIVERLDGDDNTDITLKVQSDQLTADSNGKFTYELKDADNGKFTITIGKTENTTKVYYLLGLDEQGSFTDLPSNGQILHSSIVPYGGKVSYTIKVVSENQTIKFYTVEVTRKQSNNTKIKEVTIKEDGYDTSAPLSLVGGERYEYTIKNNDAGIYFVNVTPDENTQSYELFFGSESLGSNPTTGILNTKISNGDNEFKLVITAQDGDVKKYELLIKKLSSENSITHIRVFNNETNVQMFNGLDDFSFNSQNKQFRIKNPFAFELAKKVRVEVESSEFSKINSTNGNSAVFILEFTSYADESRSTGSIVVTSQNNRSETYDIVIDRQKADDDNKLKEVIINAKSFELFSSGTFNYDKIVFDRNIGIINIEGIKNSSKSVIKYTLDGVEQANTAMSILPGRTIVVKIIVTAQNTTVSTYTFTFQAAEQDNVITNIKLDNIPSYTFVSTTTDTIRISVPYSIATSRVTITTKAQHAQKHGEGALVLTAGQTEIFSVYLTSEAGVDGKEYRFEITREDAREFKDLSHLSVEYVGGSKTFIPGEVGSTFTLRVDRAVTSMDVLAKVTGDNGEKIIGGISSTEYRKTHHLESGVNTIIIRVADEIGGEKEYKLVITRANDINDFDYVVVDGKQYSKSEFTDKVLTIPEVVFSKENVSFGISLKDQESKVSYTGNLSNSNKTWILDANVVNEMSFTITSEAGTKVDTFIIKLKRAGANSANELSDLQVLVTYTDGTVDLLNHVTDFVTYKSFDLRVDRVISRVEVIAKVLVDDRSIVRDMGTGIQDGQYVTFKKEYPLNQAGAITVIDIKVEAENPLFVETYKLNIVRKNAINEITNIKINDGQKDVYDALFKDNNLGTFDFKVSKLFITITRKDEFSRVYLGNTLIPQGQNEFEVILVDGNNKTFVIKSQTDVTSNEHSDFKETIVTFTYSRTPASDLAELATLEAKVNGIDLLEDLFAGKTYIYTNLRVDREHLFVFISATAKNNGKVEYISGTNSGNNVLTSGIENTYTIKVTAEDGIATNLYVIKIVNKDNDNEITDITAVGLDLTPKFDKGKTTYTLEDLKYKVLTIAFDITLKNEYATVTINGKKYTNGDQLTLKDGSNPFVILAISDYGTQSPTSYTVTVIREEAYKITFLDNLEVVDSVSKDVISFDNPYQEGTYDYEINLAEDFEINKIDISVKFKNEDKQRKEIISGATSFVDIVVNKSADGAINHTIIFNILAEDNVKQQYKIVIKKGIAYSDDKSFDEVILVDSIDGTNHLIGFESAEYNYDVTVGFEIDKLDLRISLSHEKAVVINKVTPLLIAGQTVTFSFAVKAEDGSVSKTYVIKIFREVASKENTLNKLEIDAFKQDGTSENFVFENFGLDKLFELRLSREFVRVNLKAYVLADDKSVVSGWGTGVKVDNLLVFTRVNPNLNPAGQTTQFSIDVMSQDNNLNDYKLNVIRKNAINEITNIKINDGQKDVYDALFKDNNLGTFDFKVSKLFITITRKDEFSRVYLGNTLIPQGQNEFEVILEDGNNKTFVIKSQTDVTSNEHSDFRELVVTFTYSRTAASDVAELATLEAIVDGIDLLENLFSGKTYIYTNLRVDRDHLFVLLKATAKNNGKVDFISGTNSGNNALTAGAENTYTIRVTAEDGISTNIYVIKIMNKDNDNEITDIVAEGLEITPNFKKDTIAYTIADLSYTYTSIAFDISLKNQYATVSINGSKYNNGDKLPLGNGSNPFVIIATSEYGTVSKVSYTVTVNREEASNENNLFKLEVKASRLDDSFEIFTFENIGATKLFEQRLDRDFARVDINAYVLASDNSTINGFGSGVVEGNLVKYTRLNVTLNPAGQTTQFSIDVVSQDNSLNDYKLNIVRKNAIIGLEDIKITYEDQDGVEVVLYDENTTSKNLGTIPYHVTELNINVTKTDEFSRLFVNGVINNESGNEVNISFTLQTGLNRKIILDSQTEIENTHKDYKNILTEFTYDKEAPFKDINLADLVVKTKDGTILPFDEGVYVDGVYNYTVNYSNLVNVSLVDIIYELKDEEKQEYKGPKETDYVINETTNNQVFRFTILAEDGAKQDYSITFMKKPISGGGGGATDNVNFKTLAVLLDDGLGGKDLIPLVDGETEYSYELSYKYGGFHLLATPEDGNAKVTYNGVEDIYFTLGYGESITIVIEITSSDKSKTESITVVVTREEATDDTVITDFTITEGLTVENISVNQTYTKYILKDYNTKEVTIKASAPLEGTIEGKATYENVVKITKSVTRAIFRSFAKNGDFEDYIVEIVKLDNDTSLKSITLEYQGEEISVKLNPDSKQDIVVDLKDIKGGKFNSIERFTLDAVSNSLNATIQGIGEKQLQAGTGGTTEHFKIVVTAENGDTEEYNIIVTRDVDPEKDVTIEDLSLTGVDSIIYLGSTRYANAKQLFVTETLTYNMTVPYELNALVLNIVNKFGATTFISINGIPESGNSINLINKNTTVTFYLVSKDQTKTTDIYTINITKEDASTDNDLVDILIDGVSLDGFVSTKYNYEIIVKYKLDLKINVEADLSDDLAMLSGSLGDVTLVHGSNNLTIKVTSQSGVTKEYRINVRALYDNNELIDLTVDNFDLDPEFEQAINDYYLDLEPEINSIYVRTTTKFNATVEGNVGQINITKNMPALSFKVLSEYDAAVGDGNSNETVYTITIKKREASSDTTIGDIIVRPSKDSKEVIPYTYGEKFDGRDINVVDLTNPAFNGKYDDLRQVYIEVIYDAKRNNTGTPSGPLILSGEVSGVNGNTYEVTVRAENGDTRLYKINVFKNVDLDSEVNFGSFELIGNDSVNYLGTRDTNPIHMFDISQMNYRFEVPFNVETFTPFVRLSGPGSISGAQRQSFEGKDEIVFEIDIYSQDGNNKLGTFVISITRKQGSDNNLLRDLRVNGKTIQGFDPLINNYQIQLGRLDKTVQIDADVQDPSAKVVGTGLKQLVSGINRFTITVTSETGDIFNYYIEIKIPSGDAYLQALFIQDTETQKFIPFEFDSDIFEYDVVVDKSVREVYVSGIASDVTGAAITGQDDYLINNEGVTTIKIHVTSVNGDQQTYTLNITKNAKLSSDTSLDELVIEGIEFKFDPETRRYDNLKVGNKVTNLSVSAKTNHKNATFEIIDANNLTEGNNTITIVVTAEDGSTGYYLVNVTREAQPDLFLTVLLILSILLWIITVLILLIRNIRQRSDRNDDVIY